MKKEKMLKQVDELMAETNLYLLETGHTDVVSMKNKVKIAMSALQKMQSELGKLGDEDSLPTWWTNKVATAVSRLDDMSDYLDTQIDEGLFFGKKGPAVISRLARGVASRVTTKGKLDRAKKKNQKIKNKIDLVKTKQDLKKNKANLRTLRRSSTYNEEVPGNAVGQGGVDMAPNAGPRLKVMNVTDRRRRKDKQPVMLKRFRQFAEEN